MKTTSYNIQNDGRGVRGRVRRRSGGTNDGGGIMGRVRRRSSGTTTTPFLLSSTHLLSLKEDKGSADGGYLRGTKRVVSTSRWWLRRDDIV